MAITLKSLLQQAGLGPIIPNTLGRLAQSVTLNVSTFDSTVSGELPSSTFQFPGGVASSDMPSNISSMVTVGSLMRNIGKLTIDQRRDNTRVYSLGKYSMEPGRVVPGVIETNLKMRHVMLYSSEFLYALGFAAGNIFNQSIPFQVEVRLSAPTGTVYTIKFEDCWISNSSTPFNMENEKDILVVEDLDIIAGEVSSTNAVFGGSLSGIAPKLTNLLNKSIDLPTI